MKASSVFSRFTARASPRSKSCAAAMSRRAKLYYLRGLRGKSARIAERTTGHSLGENGGEE